MPKPEYTSRMRRVLLLLVALACTSAIVIGPQRTPPATLEINFLDTEVGQATRTDGSFSMTNERTGYTNEYPATRTTAATH